MAVVTSKNPSSVTIKFNMGVDENSKYILKSKTFPGLNPEAETDNVQTFADEIVALQENDFYSLVKTDYTTLSK